MAGIANPISVKLVLELEAFGGSEDLSADSPSSLAGGISGKLFAKHGYRDKIKVSTVGPNGYIFRSTVSVGSTVTAYHGAVAPFSYNIISLKYQTENEPTWVSINSSDYYIDPVDGKIYITYGAIQTIEKIRLGCQMWVFDRRKTYPCEIPATMHGAIDGVCNGYATHHYDSATSKGFLLSIKQKSDGFIFPQPVTWYCGEPSETITSVSQLSFSRPYLSGFPPPENYEDVWYVDNVSSNNCGIIMIAGNSPKEQFHLHGNIMGCELPVPNRYLKSEIKTAVCDITVSNPVRTNHTLGFFYTGDSPEHYETTHDLNGLRLVGLIATVDDDGFTLLSFKALNNSINISGLTYDSVNNEQRGTVDITGIYQELADHTFENNEIPMMILMGPYSPSGSTFNLDSETFLKSWITDFSYIPGDPDPTYYAIGVSHISVDSLVFSKFRIQPDATGIIGSRYVD